ncbi:MAG: hypothetical protein AABX34_06520 [Nanoarchaeota archaeon]
MLDEILESEKCPYSIEHVTKGHRGVIEVENGQISLIKLKNSNDFFQRQKFKFLVTYFGDIYHEILRGDKARLFFTYYDAEGKLRLTYFLSNKGTSLKSLKTILDAFYEFAELRGAKYLEAIIVNPSISDKMLRRGGWYYSHSDHDEKFYYRNV